MALTKITGQVINNTTGLVVGVTTVGGGVSATDGFFSGIVTAVGNASFSGNLTVGGVLTYEDVTNVDSVGLVTARNGIVVGSGITLSKDGDIFATGITTISENLKVGTGVTISPDGDAFFTGVCTATTFKGDGSQLSNVTSTTINNNADNRVITGSGTANTLNGESNVQIDSSGRLLIGTTTEGHDDADELTLNGTRTGITIRSADDDYGNIFFSDATSTASEYIGAVQYYHADNSMRLKTSSTDRLVIDSSGNTTISSGNLVIGTSGKGIDFSAQTSSSTSGVTVGAELFDHYEEGTWTPILTNGETCSVYAATYTRIGRQVTAYCFIYNFSDFNGNNNAFNIEGLPFSKDTTNGNYYGGGMIGYVHSMNYGYPLLPLVSGTPALYFHRQDGTTGTWKYQDFHNVGNGSGGMLIITAVYDTAA